MCSFSNPAERGRLKDLKAAWCAATNANAGRRANPQCLATPFAHAMESVTKKYAAIATVEAVAWGMIAAAFLGHDKLGLMRAADVPRIVAMIRRLGPLPPGRVLASRSGATFARAMSADKKKRAAEVLRFVLSAPQRQARCMTTGFLFTSWERVTHFTPVF